MNSEVNTLTLLDKIDDSNRDQFHHSMNSHKILFIQDFSLIYDNDFV